MWNIRRRVRSEGIPRDRYFVVSFHFLGVPTARSHFWLLFRDEETEVCIRDPGYEIGLAVTAHIRMLTRIWLGHLPLVETVRTWKLLLEDDRQHIRAFPICVADNFFQRLEAQCRLRALSSI